MIKHSASYEYLQMNSYFHGLNNNIYLLSKLIFSLFKTRESHNLNLQFNDSRETVIHPFITNEQDLIEFINIALSYIEKIA